MACRNGWFFVLDRVTGKNIVSKEYVKTNWVKGLDGRGQPIPNNAKEPQIDGSLVSPNQGGAANWPPPAYDPDTGLFYVNATRAFSIWYLYDLSDKPEGWGGTDRGGWSEAMLQAIDYKTGAIRWSHKWDGGGARAGILSTAGNLIFTGDGAGNFVAFDARDGKALWHANLASQVSNAPIAYEVDGSEYVVVGAGDSLLGFTVH
jgi:alcohol dehydrogenase (cytochrome c)